jgi:FixJ family two-component response regulator
MSMPEMDGPGLHAVLSSKDADLASRMLFVTGGAFTSQAHDFLREKAEHVLFKPVSARSLRGLVAELLAKRGPR